MVESTSLQDQALVLLKQGDYRQALLPAQKAVRLRESILGVSHLQVAESLNVLGLTFHHLAEIDQALEAHEQALKIREELAGVHSKEVGESLTHLARVWMAKGKFLKAQGMLERAIRIREEVYGPTHVALAESLMYLAMVQGLQMELTTALATQARAVDIFDKDSHSPPIEHSMALTSYGVILSRNGELAKGKDLIQRALLLQEGSLEPIHPIVARTLDSLAELETKMGHMDVALDLAKRALQIRENRFGPDHPEVSASLNTIGTLLWKQGDLPKAVQSFQRALSIVEQSAGSVHPVVAANLLSLGEINRQMENLPIAREMFSRALTIQEATLGPQHNDVATTLTRLSWVASSQGDHSQAQVLLERAINIRENALGDIHPDLAILLNELARVKHRQGQLANARPHYERARQIYLAVSRLNQDLDDVTFSRLHQQGISSLQDYALLLAQLSQQDKERSIVTDGFLVAEQARGWLVQAAVAKAMARKHARQSVDVELAKHIDDLRRRHQELWGTLHALYGQPSQDPSVREELSTVKTEVRNIQQDLKNKLSQLESRFPQYAELAFPKPLDLQSVQELLNPGEALISFVVWDHMLQIWVVRQGQPPVFHNSGIDKTKLSNLVTQIRASLGSAKPPFDVQTAHQLYQWLFQPLEAHLSDVDNLIIIPDEVLLPLPFAALITDKTGPAFEHLAQLSSSGKFIPPAGFSHYTKVEWLIKRFAITVVPSASAFKLLRQSVQEPQNRKDRFIGFGDPVFSGDGQERGGNMPSLQASRSAFEQLRMMNALPGTQQELKAIAKTLGVNPETSLFLQQRATETQVRQLLNSGRLGNTQVLSFATHGLLAGQLNGLVEPALVLTIPLRPTQEDDGLLTMGEILDFQLPQVDWVILSACNTAGGDGSGQGLSGLARAFFFAGAKALLVSHWSVDDRATQALMTEVFRLFGKDPTLSKSAALREGMLTVMQQSQGGSFPYFSHPYAWAPFFLVGDGM
ncbi:MAG: CHAT domain-containing tetratricopeptide repeat protein [Nitrospirales bacterium]|nr:CHAT domain-containing protein [Nitrospirales bacterium]